MGSRAAPSNAKATQLERRSVSKSTASCHRNNNRDEIETVQSNERITFRLGVHAIGDSLADSLDTSKRSAVTDIL